MLKRPASTASKDASVVHVELEDLVALLRDSKPFVTAMGKQALHVLFVETHRRGTDLAAALKKLDHPPSTQSSLTQ